MRHAVGLCAGPIIAAIAATDYVRAVPESVRAYLPAGHDYIRLGTDDFGCPVSALLQPLWLWRHWRL